MADELVLYYSPLSRARTAHWMLEEVGQPYRLQIVNLQKGEQKRASFLALNPMGKLPTLTHRGVVVTESAAIVAYLADAFPAAKLAPALDEPARGTYLRWMFFGAGCVDPGLIDKMLQRPAPDTPTAIGYGQFEDMLNALEKAVTPGPYILGDRFSAVDVFIGAQIGFGMMMVKAIEPRPAFQKYLERCTQRPAWQRANTQAQQHTAALQAASQS
jgi:glutathione S-transferase